jgi:hypothetical protein
LELLNLTVKLLIIVRILNLSIGLPIIILLGLWLIVVLLGKRLLVDCLLVMWSYHILLLLLLVDHFDHAYLVGIIVLRIILVLHNSIVKASSDYLK